MSMKSDMFHPPIIQSALAGIANFQFCQKMLELNVSMTILGGLSIDKKCKNATQLLLNRGRKEFLLSERENEIKRWCIDNLRLKKKRLDQIISTNVRIVEIDYMSKIWLNHLNLYVDYLEINAHCRQEEIVSIGGGQALLYNLANLERLLQEIKQFNPHNSFGIKIRGHVIQDANSLIRILERYECKFIHIDAMIPDETRADIGIIQEFAESTNIPIIGNNSVRTIEDVQKMLSVGAKAVSIARPLIDNPLFIKELIEKYIRDANE